MGMVGEQSRWQRNDSDLVVAENHRFPAGFSRLAITTFSTIRKSPLQALSGGSKQPRRLSREQLARHRSESSMQICCHLPCSVLVYFSLGAAHGMTR
ncbi:uncharacterized protein K441DRAFT_653067 [Cenococcum geophilum 1.58]|uniref:uncharacterized protein n=1 Tax=Cenococcum geophilum 1.58 TaxID=794803 RepID=UPI00358E8FC6|nr:hypothetical protein K441DRAFT_653067 [Cenococcum geophilum 1.58]